MNYNDYSMITTGDYGEPYFVSDDCKRACIETMNYEGDEIAVTESMVYTDTDGLQSYFSFGKKNPAAEEFAKNGRIVGTRMWHWVPDSEDKFDGHFEFNKGDTLWDSKLDYLTYIWDGYTYDDPDERLDNYLSLLDGGASDSELKNADAILYELDIDPETGMTNEGEPTEKLLWLYTK